MKLKLKFEIRFGLTKKKPNAYKIFKKKNCVLKNKIERHFSNVPKKKA